jgi:hypothetical protein
MLRDPRTLLAGVSIGILQYVPLGNGTRLVSAGDRHSCGGMKPVRHGGGWLIDGARSSAAWLGNGAATVCAIEAPCGRNTSTCSTPVW